MKLFQFDENQYKELYKLNQLIDEFFILIKNIENTIVPSNCYSLSAIQNKLYYINTSWNMIVHINTVLNNSQTRDIYNDFLSKTNSLYIKLRQNKTLYEHLLFIKKHEYRFLSIEEQKILDNELLLYKLNGIELSASAQEKFTALNQTLSELETKFEQNILDSTENYLYIARADEIHGVPKELLCQHDDGYKITLDAPCYLLIMKFAHNRDLRHKIHKAYMTRASELSDNISFDNSQNIKDILKIRHALANLLNMKDFAELSLTTKMANSSDEVIEFLYSLADKAKDYAKNEILELRTIQPDIQAFDIQYCSEKLQEQKYYSSYELSQYFPLSQVLIGLFSLIKKMYGIDIVENKTISKWHKDVFVFELISNNKLIAYIYCDFYSRKGKNTGAWMHDGQSRHLDDELHLPIAYIACNFATTKECLLTFDDLETIFHEFGHGLQHVLTVISHSSISGTNGIEWDGVEIASQFMEYFLWDEKILQSCSRHSITGDALPHSIYQKLDASRHFQAGIKLLKQVELSLYDMLIHTRNNDHFELLNYIRNEIGVLPYSVYDRFPNSFGHIFSPEYAAGYYSYKWSEVIAADIFTAFDTNNVQNDIQDAGKHFLTTFLKHGGLYSMTYNFIEFMKRKPNIKAFLKYYGMQ